MKLPFDKCVFETFPKGSVTQWFGENADLYRRWGLAYHNGIDLVAPHGTPLYAVEDGVVVGSRLAKDGYGRHIQLRSTKKYNGQYRCWVYGHLNGIKVHDGDVVKAGDFLATMGNTGFVVSGATPFWEYNPFAGTHLHIGLRMLIPDENGWSYSGDKIKYQVADYNNGVKGAIDPIHILQESEVPTKRDKMLTIISLLNNVVELYKRMKK